MAFTGKGSGTAVSSSPYGKTLAQLKTFCCYHGWDQTHTTGLAELDNFINDTIFMVCMLAPWPDYFKSDGKVTFPAGTQTISNIQGASSVVTVTTATAHGWSVGDLVDIEDTTNYDDTDITVATVPTTTTFTYASSTTTQETSGTTKRRDRETLSETNIIRIGAVQPDYQSDPLDECSMEQWLHWYRYNKGTGPPSRYGLEPYVDTGARKMFMYMYPKPTESRTYYFTYQWGPAALTDDAHKTDLADRLILLLHQVLILRLKQRDKEPGASIYTPELMALIATAYNNSRPSFMPQQARSLDSTPLGKWRLRASEKVFTT